MWVEGSQAKSALITLGKTGSVLRKLIITFSCRGPSKVRPGRFSLKRRVGRFLLDVASGPRLPAQISRHGNQPNGNGRLPSPPHWNTTPKVFG